MRRRAPFWFFGVVLIGIASLAGHVAAQSQPPVTLPPLVAGARVTVVSSCPGNTGQITEAQFAFMAATQDLLLSNLAVVQGYATPQAPSVTRPPNTDPALLPTAFGVAGMGGPWDRRVVFLQAVGGTVQLQGHADVLTALVPRPDRVVVCPVAVSLARRNEITMAITELVRTLGEVDQLYGLDNAPGRDASRVDVRLRADGVELATMIQARYGGEVVITVGNMPWPDRTTPDTTAPMSCAVPVPISTGPRFQWAMPKRLTVRTGSSFDLHAVVKNPSTKWVPLPVMKAVITAIGSRTVIAIDARPIAYALAPNLVQPGKTTDITVRVGTDSCRASDPYALPPGRYTVHLTSALPSDAAVSSPAVPLKVTS